MAARKIFLVIATAVIVSGFPEKLHRGSFPDHPRYSSPIGHRYQSNPKDQHKREHHYAPKSDYIPSYQIPKSPSQYSIPSYTSGERHGGSGIKYHSGEGYNKFPSYSFDYAVEDKYSGNNFGHQEKRDGANVKGSYHVLLPDGRKQVVTYYVTGDSGFVAKVTYEGEARYPEAKTPYKSTSQKQHYKQPPKPYQPNPYKPEPYQPPKPYQPKPEPYQPKPYQPKPYKPEPYQPTPYKPEVYQPTPYKPEPYQPSSHELYAGYRAPIDPSNSALYVDQEFSYNKPVPTYQTTIPPYKPPNSFKEPKQYSSYKPSPPPVSYLSPPKVFKPIQPTYQKPAQAAYQKPSPRYVPNY